MPEVKIDEMVIKDKLYEEEARDLKSFAILFFGKAFLYLRFINEKGLLPEFDKWRKKLIFEVV